MRCNGDYDWAQLLAQRGLGGSPGGYTRFGESFTELSPGVCSFLDRYAYTDPKPPYWCKGTKTVTELVQKRYRWREGKPLLKNGKPVLRKGKPVYVWKTHIEVRYVPVQHVREIDVKCPGADEWGRYSYSLGMLAHESYHLGGVRDEAQAECYGLQAVARTAVRLGATSSEAKIVSDYAWTTLYPALERKEPAYWSPECRSGGALDLTPGDGVWPSS